MSPRLASTTQQPTLVLSYSTPWICSNKFRYLLRVAFVALAMVWGAMVVGSRPRVSLGDRPPFIPMTEVIGLHLVTWPFEPQPVLGKLRT
jgi:hypothetical protein